MIRISVVAIIVFMAASAIFALKSVEGSQPTLQKTIQVMFSERSEAIHDGTCKWVRSSSKQTKMCKRDPGLIQVIATARQQAITACEESFQYDRWNCSLAFNNKAKRSVFNKIYRETAFVHALISASLTHAIAKGCASGNLVRCSCLGNMAKNSSWQWKRGGCGDDLRYGKRITRNFLDFKHAGNDPIGEVLKQDALVGIESISSQMREVCKCHGFSGSCTTKTCWKRLGPFNSAMGLLKKHYHHAIKRKIMNYTLKRAATPKIRNRIKIERKNLLYFQKTPNLCIGTIGRVCKDRENCATLCCGRGYLKLQKVEETRCKCRMVNCCFVKCDTCKENVDIYICK